MATLTIYVPSHWHRKARREMIALVKHSDRAVITRSHMGWFPAHFDLHVLYVKRTRDRDGYHMITVPDQISTRVYKFFSFGQLKYWLYHTGWHLLETASVRNIVYEFVSVERRKDNV